MTNNSIADNFSLLSKLMDIHGENSFKAKSYSVAAFTIEKLPGELSTLSEEKIFAIKGIGEAVGKKIILQLATGQLPQLNDYIANTPPGIIEMLSIKGLGPKKISAIWKVLEIESLGELLYACNENRLQLYKGFGAKTQQNIKESIEFYFSNRGSYLYAEIISYANNLAAVLQKQFPQEHLLLTNDCRRHTEVVTKLEFVTTVSPAQLNKFLPEIGFEQTEGYASYKNEHVAIVFHYATPSDFYTALFETSCSEEFLAAFKKDFTFRTNEPYNNEEEIFESNRLSFIPPYLRESADIIAKAKTNTLPTVIEYGDIAGIIHSHSKWSDGNNTIEEMATSAKDKGLQYLVISDHSQTAFYAGGLKEERVLAQHQEIDFLNKKLFPFKIFKSIESDILNDGSLDYHPNLLQRFDIVIASIHSNLKMPEEKAMMRLMRAIENPYTSILGHMTGRLLLSRNGYPLDYKKIIDACAENNVVIELNAHPRRLDIYWQWVPYALEKKVLISINPDAHSIEGFDDIVYGTLAAQKAGVTKQQNLSSLHLSEFEVFVQQQQSKRS